MQDCSISSLLTIDKLQSCTKPVIFCWSLVLLNSNQNVWFHKPSSFCQILKQHYYNLPQFREPIGWVHVCITMAESCHVLRVPGSTKSHLSSKTWHLKVTYGKQSLAIFSVTLYLIIITGQVIKQSTNLKYQCGLTAIVTYKIILYITFAVDISVLVFSKCS